MLESHYLPKMIILPTKPSLAQEIPVCRRNRSFVAVEIEVGEAEEAEAEAEEEQLTTIQVLLDCSGRLDHTSLAYHDISG